MEDERKFTELKQPSTSLLSGNTGGDHRRLLPTITVGGHSSTAVTLQIQEEHDHADRRDNCRNDNDFYCWLKCLDLPPDDIISIHMHLNNGESLYCLDPSALKDTGNITEAYDACNYGRVVGGGGTEYDVHGYLKPPDRGGAELHGCL